MKCLCRKCREIRESECGEHVNVYECTEARKRAWGMCVIAGRSRKREMSVVVHVCALSVHSREATERGCRACVLSGKL